LAPAIKEQFAAATASKNPRCSGWLISQILLQPPTEGLEFTSTHWVNHGLNNEL
jgi:hypothetical protein